MQFEVTYFRPSRNIIRVTGAAHHPYVVEINGDSVTDVKDASKKYKWSVRNHPIGAEIEAAVNNMLIDGTPEFYTHNGETYFFGEE